MHRFISTMVFVSMPDGYWAIGFESENVTLEVHVVGDGLRNDKSGSEPV